MRTFMFYWVDFCYFAIVSYEITYQHKTTEVVFNNNYHKNLNTNKLELRQMKKLLNA